MRMKAHLIINGSNIELSIQERIIRLIPSKKYATSSIKDLVSAYP